MADDPLSSRKEPPKAAYAYDRRTDSLRQPPSLQKRASASSLLSMFKARPSPSSVSKMERTRGSSKPVAYVDLTDDSDPQPNNVLSPVTPGYVASDFVHSLSPEEAVGTSNDTKSDGDVFLDTNVSAPLQQTTTSRRDVVNTPSRDVPARSTRSEVSYATPKRPIAPKRSSTKKAEPILASDTLTSPEVNRKASKPVHIKPDTARNRVRDGIATVTKAKSDAYLLEHKEYFLPLLPPVNYITKLQQSGLNNQATVPHQQLQSQPEHVTAEMKPYQLKGLSFLATMYKNGMSAVLGDEMGLGKTLQTLSLIQYLENTCPSPAGIPRPYLVVCPLSVLESWYNESRKWTPNLRPMRFHGNMSEREHLKQRATGNIDRFGNETAQSKNKKSKRRANATPTKKVRDEDQAGFDILITTYEVFTAEQNWFKKTFVWRYVILDEGHKIKNEKSNVAQALQGLKAEHRLLLTGTPVQNNLREMWALLHWLFPDVFTDKTADAFSTAFDLSKGTVSTSFMNDARRLLELVMLRRLKSSPGVDLNLPPKYEHLLYVPLTPIQRFWYTRLLTKAGGPLIEDLFKGVKIKEQASLEAEKSEDNDLSELEKAVATADQDDGQSDQWAASREIIQQAIQNDATGEKETRAYQKLLNLVMQLRKCCVHPYQIKGAAPDPYILGDHVMHASSKFLVLNKFIDELVVKQKKKIIIFSGFTSVLDYCEDLLCHKGANQHDASFRYLRLDGRSARAKRNLDIRLFNDPSSEYQVFLISTRAGGLGLNLTAASEIIFLDEDWNPQQTLQATARAHRIGQTKPVTIYKICTQGTVEEQMMGRIRKKLYLSAKITESMRDIHSTAEPEPSLKRKRGPDPSVSTVTDDAPQLGTSQLMSLIRRGATTLTHPEIDVNEMLSWDFETIIEKCKDRPIDPRVADATVHDQEQAAIDEEEWLAKMERVETAVLDGVKYQKQIDKDQKKEPDLVRADRRAGKNTTVMIDGFAINKESLNCADWEAVPTMAGKDPRLATPKREKGPPIQHQDFCQVCHDGGEVVYCSSCPRLYHVDCLSEEFKAKAEGKFNFHCSQHQCFDCEKSTSDAGGLIYRCRFCDKGFCEDCLEWDNAKLIGGTLPEYDMLEYHSTNAWYVECHHCVAAEQDVGTKVYLDSERKRIAKEHKKWIESLAKAEDDAVKAMEERKKLALEKAKADADAEAAALMSPPRDETMTDVDAAASVPPSCDETMTDATTLEPSRQITPLATDGHDHVVTERPRRNSSAQPPSQSLEHPPFASRRVPSLLPSRSEAAEFVDGRIREYSDTLRDVYGNRLDLRWDQGKHVLYAVPFGQASPPVLGTAGTLPTFNPDPLPHGHGQNQPFGFPLSAASGQSQHVNSYLPAASRQNQPLGFPSGQPLVYPQPATQSSPVRRSTRTQGGGVRRSTNNLSDPMDGGGEPQVGGAESENS